MCDEGGALEAEARCGTIGAADTAAGIAEGLLNLFASEGRHGGANPFRTSGGKSCFRANWSGRGGSPELGRGDAENAAGGENYGAFDDVLESADVAGPVVGH